MIQALSHIYVQLGQTEKALEYLKKAAKFDPRDPEVKQLIVLNIHDELPYKWWFWGQTHTLPQGFHHLFCLETHITALESLLVSGFMFSNIQFYVVCFIFYSLDSPYFMLYNYVTSLTGFWKVFVYN